MSNNEQIKPYPCLTIFGRPISKKNSKRIFRYGSRIGIHPSSAFNNFESNALSQLAQCRLRYDGLLEVHYIFHLKGKMRIDADNAMAGINDILQKASVISDDKNIIAGNFRLLLGCKDWKTEIQIIPLDIGT